MRNVLLGQPLRFTRWNDAHSPPLVKCSGIPLTTWSQFQGEERVVGRRRGKAPLHKQRSLCTSLSEFLPLFFKLVFPLIGLLEVRTSFTLLRDRHLLTIATFACVLQAQLIKIIFFFFSRAKSSSRYIYIPINIYWLTHSFLLLQIYNPPDRKSVV